MSYLFSELKGHCKTYFSFSPREKKQLLISAFFFGFILSFRMWGGGSSFEINSGLINWVSIFLLSVAVLFINFSVQKIFAIKKGFLLHFFWWFPGLLIGVFLTFLSFGYIPFLFPGTTYLEHLKGLRLGEFRYGTNTKDLAEVSIAGIVSNVIVAMIFGFLYLATLNNWIFIFIKINLIYAFFSMLPIPTISALKLRDGATPGLNIFFFSRRLYIFILGSIIAFSLLIYYAIAVFGSFWSLIIGAFVGLIALLVSVKLYGTQ